MKVFQAFGWHLHLHLHLHSHLRLLSFWIAKILKA
jgi:hypothetical protein